MPIPNRAAEAISACSKNGFTEDKKSSERNQSIAGSIVGIVLLFSGVGIAVGVLRRKISEAHAAFFRENPHD
jgi:hypothetical protein